jgi:hypothetical protein
VSQSIIRNLRPEQIRHNLVPLDGHVRVALFEEVVLGRRQRELKGELLSLNRGDAPWSTTTERMMTL